MQHQVAINICSVQSQGREEEALDRKYIGSFDGKIVGVNHYRGHVNNREMVRFKRTVYTSQDATGSYASAQLPDYGCSW